MNNETKLEYYDVVIVGAGISGLGAACHLQQMCPDKSFLILEGRQEIGGTWDLFKYPGIRSDSDLYTFGYDFNCNGYAEILYVDKDEDGLVDFLYIDRNENETDDLFITFVDFEGERSGLFEYDDNEDGIIEKECADFDNDGKPDECRNVG